MSHLIAVAHEWLAVRAIGWITQLQVAPCSLKSGSYPDENFHPERLVAVPSLLLSQAGAIGLTHQGESLMDVHHREHPAARRWGKDNGISVGFTSHYAAMRDYFGPHLVDGCAAENIMIDTQESWTLADLAGGLWVGVPDEAGVLLGTPLVASPCVPFTRWAARNSALSGPSMREALRFLNNGRRGFYVALTNPLPQATISVGLPVYTLIRHTDDLRPTASAQYEAGIKEDG